MDAPKKNSWDSIMGQLSKEHRDTHELQNEYEKLREELAKAGSPPVADKIKGKMQSLEGKFRDIWEPHQELVGPCPKCLGGVRVPGLTPDGVGFGCLDCHYFEVFEAASAQN